MKFTKIIACALLLLAGNLHAQLTVSRTAPYNNIHYLVQNLLLGSGVAASNITYTGDDTAIGFFNGTHSNIGLDSGLLITNGAITDALGPLWTINNNNNYSWPDCFLHTDNDLAILANTSVTSAAILQFDFVPSSDTIKFTFVFASEEYPDYVNEFNDAFGFFISGPGISGPFSGNAENIALVPGTTRPISINSISYDSNCAYFICNDYTTPSFYTANSCTGISCPTAHYDSNATVGYGGFTVPLTAIAVVQCGKKYHIKLGICNAVDCAVSSGLFIQAQSFHSGVNIKPKLSVLCPGSDSIKLDATGAATYAWSPSTGLNCTTCATAKALPHHTITYTVVGTTGACVSKDSATIVLDSASGMVCCNTYIVKGGSASLSVSPTKAGNTYSWSPTAGLSCTTCPDPIASPTTSTTYYLTIKDSAGCTKRDSVRIDYNCANLTIPNVFTPNGDKLNDLFFVNATYADSYTIYIYDRWGKEIFTSNQATNPWDGTTKGGSQVPDGVYYYIVKLECGGTKTEKKGFVQLLR